MRSTRHGGFGRIPSPPDPRDYSMRQMMRTLRALGVKRKWSPGRVLDQEDTPHCVGFGFAAWGICTPVVDPWTNDDGHRIYYEAKAIDGEPNQENGSTVRSGAKAMVQDGRLGVYSFAENLDVATEYVSSTGPVVLGIDWYDGMCEPDPDGIVRPTGGIVGGHCVLWYGVDDRYAYLRNSWGDSWGRDGDCLIALSDLAIVFASDGEACAGLELPLPGKDRPGCVGLRTFRRRGRRS